MRYQNGDHWLPFGSVGRPHGVRGEVYLHAYNSSAGIPSELKCPVEVRIGKAETGRSGTLLDIRGGKGRFVIRLDGMANRDSVAELVNLELSLPRGCFPPLGPNEFYVSDICGYDVYAETGEKLGGVDSLFWNGAQDIMRVLLTSGDEQLIPLVPRHVVRVDPGQKQIVVVVDE